MLTLPLVVLRGGGDLATGIAHRLSRAGFPIVVLELAQPRVIRRRAAFAEAQFTGEWTVEGVTARACDGPCLGMGFVPVLTDPEGKTVEALRPPVLVDARMMKKNIDTTIADAPLVVAVGPGYRAGVDAHAVVETMRGHHLGRVYLEGEALRDTGVPGDVGGHGARRVVRAPEEGLFEAAVAIGDAVEAGQLLGRVGVAPVAATLTGKLRGLMRPGLRVFKGEKVADIDPRPDAETDTISDKARAVGGGVLEALMIFRARWS